MIRSRFSNTLALQLNALRDTGFVLIKRPQSATADLDSAQSEITSHLAGIESSWKYSAWRFFNQVNSAEKRHAFPMPLSDGSAVTTVLNESIGHVRELLDIMLAPNAALVELAGMISLPGSEEQKWHCDVPFYDGKWGQNPLVLSVFVAMEDITVEKGPTCLYAGTHTEAFEIKTTPGKVLYNSDGSVEGPGENTTSLRRQRLAQETACYAPLKAGDMLIFDTKIFHYGAANHSSVQRDLLSLSFQKRDEAGECHPITGFTYHIQPDLVGAVELRDFPALDASEAPARREQQTIERRQWISRGE
jgi:hypothetical protein